MPCPYDDGCPHLKRLEMELHDAEDDTHDEIKSIYKAMDDMRKTLYVIVGILFAELGVMIL